MPIYKVPFELPAKEFVGSGYLGALLKEYDVVLEYDFDCAYDADVCHKITGTLDNLTCFMADIMCEVTRDYFDAAAWEKNVKEKYEWNPNGLGPQVGCYV